MLAARTGQTVGNASHHLKVLAAAGLVEEAPELARDRRELWWRLVTAATRWSRQELTDPAAVDAALEAEALALRRQETRVRDWMANGDSDPTWAAVAYATSAWMRLTPDELRELSEEVAGLLPRWADRPVPEAGQHREPVYVFSRGFPSQP